MGSGVALQIREKWPHVFTKYQSAIANWKKDLLEPLLGQVIWAEAQQGILVANAITQEHFGRDGKKYVSYQAIGDAFAEIASVSYDNGYHVHFPTIGAGLGGGDWGIISDIIRSRFQEFGNSENYYLWINQ
jgi:O-acetyl-ADP-ribose deacetylase (regulator of RNase III)